MRLEERLTCQTLVSRRLGESRSVGAVATRIVPAARMRHRRPRRAGSTHNSTITVDGRAAQEDARSIVWHGPGQGIGENYSDSGQTLLELLNRFGADGWGAGRPAGLPGRRRRDVLLGGGSAFDGVHLQTPSPGIVRSGLCPP
jgi:hypothetical protein